MLTIILAVVSMAIRDMLATFLTVAEARGRATLAGAMDALGDLAGIAVTVVGAGSVIQDGLTGHTVLLIAAMTITSFAGTLVWTKLANHIQASNAPSQVDQLEVRLERLEKNDRLMRAALRDR